MFYTVTLNPSLDYLVSVEDFRPGLTNRACSERLLPGGKGINVSSVLRNLGIESTALGFVAGFTGAEVARRLEELGIRNGMIPLEEGFTRINVKLTSVEGTEINGRGPAVSARKLELLMDRLARLGEGDVLFLAGSVPASVPPDIYRRIMELLDGKGVLTAVDAEKEMLLEALAWHPFLVKPNSHELGGIFGREFRTREETVPYARKLQEMGAQNVLVSMAGEGAVLAASDGQVFGAPAPKGTLVNGVGAGDSMVAAFMADWLESRDYRHAFCMGVAAGSASAFSDNLASRGEIERIYCQVEAERIRQG